MRAKTARIVSADISQSGLEVVTLRRLWLGLERTQEAIERSLLAYRESRELLRRIENGGAHHGTGDSLAGSTDAQTGADQSTGRTWAATSDPRA